MVEQEEVFEGFKQEVKEQIDDVKSNVRSLNRDRKKYENFLISSLKDLNLKKQQMKDLIKLIEIVQTEIAGKAMLCLNIV